MLQSCIMSYNKALTCPPELCYLVDYTHSGTGCTALMATAVRGFLPQIQQLLSMGADINKKAVNGW